MSGYSILMEFNMISCMPGYYSVCLLTIVCRYHFKKFVYVFGKSTIALENE